MKQNIIRASCNTDHTIQQSHGKLQATVATNGSHRQRYDLISICVSHCTGVVKLNAIRATKARLSTMRKGNRIKQSPSTLDLEPNLILEG